MPGRWNATRLAELIKRSQTTMECAKTACERATALFAKIDAASRIRNDRIEKIGASHDLPRDVVVDARRIT